MRVLFNVIIMATLFVLILYYLKLNNPSEAKPLKTQQNSSPAQLTFNKSLDDKVLPESKPLINKKKDQYSSVFVSFRNVENRSNSDESELDYVTAYREWQYFANCYTDVEDFHNEADPLERLENRFETNPRESQDKPNQVQNTYYSLHVQECKRLIAGDTDDYYSIMSKLRKRFESIEAKTDEEKDLKHALEMKEQLEGFKYELSRISRGELTNSTEESKNLELKIQQLSDEILFIYESNEEISEQQALRIDALSSTIDQLRQKQIKSRVVDDEMLSQASQKLDGYLNSIQDFLVNNQSSDGFLILSKALYEVEYFSKESSVIKQLKNDLAIYDAYYLNLLNHVTLPMVACTMGHPCDAKSELALSFCLGLKDSMFIQACDSSLLDFYYNFYIGPNQMADVNLYFNYLREKYAK